MNKHSKFKLILFVALLGVVMVLTNCKGEDEEITSNVLIANTNDATRLSQRWATLNGLVNAREHTATISFEYGTTTAYDHVIKATPDTITGSTSITINANISDLTPDTEYHFRIVALSSGVSTYGYDYVFNTLATEIFDITFNPDLTYGSLSDVDGNTYKTIMIGDQTWMAENLRTSKYNDGLIIPRIVEESDWFKLSTPGYSWYNNVSVNYGAIYNWYTVNTGKLCPAGWHVPSDAEWTTLTNYLGGEAVAGKKQKETGIAHWTSPNTGSTNESGFTALPGGYRNYSGGFGNINRSGYWWSAAEKSSSDAYFRAMNYSYSNVDRSSSNKRSGLSVRCIQD
jgi:uncharacterized protein (TIGR02145 family)